MELRHEIQTAQKLQMSQNQIQSLEVLSMDSTQLREFLQNEYLENPLLEFRGNQDAEHGPSDISSCQEPPLTYGKTYEEMVEEEDQRRRDLPDKDPDLLKKNLLYQLPFDRFTSGQWELFHYMTDCLDETGFFTTPLTEVAKYTHQELPVVEAALHTLQQLEPRGIFARDLRECLLLQLEASGRKDSDTWNVVSWHLSDVAKGRISAISRSLSLTTAQVRSCIEQIAQLNPRPMNAFGLHREAYTVPDIFLRRDQEGWEVELNDRWVEDYQINDYYIRMMKESQDEELLSYFRAKLERIRMIQNSIRQRRQTILHITKAIVERQKAFFEGNGPLTPMTMSELAGKLNIHPSTVSRTVKGKYLQYSKGSMAMRELFSTPVSGNSEHTALNAEGIKTLLRSLIQEENKKKPYSDQKLLELLKAKGISISRRAIAQYRDELGIKSSYERRIL